MLERLRPSASTQHFHGPPSPRRPFEKVPIQRHRKRQVTKQEGGEEQRQHMLQSRSSFERLLFGVCLKGGWIRTSPGASMPHQFRHEVLAMSTSATLLTELPSNHASNDACRDLRIAQHKYPIRSSLSECLMFASTRRCSASVVGENTRLLHRKVHDSKRGSALQLVQSRRNQ